MSVRVPTAIERAKQQMAEREAKQLRTMENKFR